MATYNGTPGNDFYNGTSDSDVIYGNDGADNLRGNAGDDFLYGGNGDDFLRGGSGVDFFDGGDGFDRISFYETNITQGVVVDLRRNLILNDGFGNRERVVSIEGLGGALPYADTFRGNDEANMLLGGQGDTIYGYGGDDQIQMGGMLGTFIDGGDGRDLVSLTSFRTIFDVNGAIVDEYATSGVIIDLSRERVFDDGFGNAGRLRSIEDIAVGGAFSNRVTGSDIDNLIESNGTGDDRLAGGGGNDELVGGLGKDLLTGGTGADTFTFRGFALVGLVPDENGNQVPYYAPADSGDTRATADRITDFSQAEGDRIDLSAMDAILDQGNLISNDAFVWRGARGFTGAAGEARYVINGGNTYVYLEVDGKAGVDMMIRLDGEHMLTASDFIL